MYNRLGGYDALAAVVDDLMGRLAADQQVGRVLEHIPDSRFHHVRQMMVDFLCAATGGPCKYVGKPMVETHKGMGLTENDWKLTVSHLKATLNKFSVPNNEQQEVINTIAGLKGSIVDS
ncbi:MAG: group 1 truncated hemoglobin [Proteobacteria bacterium]|nr:group 1 truncated hemoglobin [Pseudomonadota bacterium]NOG59962.1 group 1 truncated hemoglobin [Pseudomonadota bacterium]